MVRRKSILASARSGKRLAWLDSLHAVAADARRAA